LRRWSRGAAAALRSGLDAVECKTAPAVVSSALPDLVETGIKRVAWARTREGKVLRLIGPVTGTWTWNPPIRAFDHIDPPWSPCVYRSRLHRRDQPRRPLQLIAYPRRIVDQPQRHRRESLHRLLVPREAALPDPFFNASDIVNVALRPRPQPRDETLPPSAPSRPLYRADGLTTSGFPAGSPPDTSPSPASPRLPHSASNSNAPTAPAPQSLRLPRTPLEVERPARPFHRVICPAHPWRLQTAFGQPGLSGSMTPNRRFHGKPYDLDFP
jgi:hypothetical protein